MHKTSDWLTINRMFRTCTNVYENSSSAIFDVLKNIFICSFKLKYSQCFPLLVC